MLTLKKKWLYRFSSKSVRLQPNEKIFIIFFFKLCKKHRLKFVRSQEFRSFFFYVLFFEWSIPNCLFYFCNSITQIKLICYSKNNFFLERGIQMYLEFPGQFFNHHKDYLVFFMIFLVDIRFIFNRYRNFRTLFLLIIFFYILKELK
jgi:hypothetical protein